MKGKEKKRGKKRERSSHHQKNLYERRLWGGVFSSSAGDEGFRRRLRNFLDSFRFDIRLVREDFDITLAHAISLSDVGLIDRKKVKEMFSKRDKIISEVLESSERGEDFEDVHSALEYFISSEVGKDVGFNLRAGRSRNDEVISAVYLWVLRSSFQLLSQIENTFNSIVFCSEKNFGKIIPFYTHLKRAQPVLFSHLVNSYAVGFLRCLDRFSDALKRFDVCHLGSGAGTGTGIPINPEKISEILGFSRVSDNSIDSTGRRDNISEIIFVFTTFSVLFSRFAEDMIFLSSDEVGLVELGEEICSGSSMMPHKKNPDTLELIRGKTSRFIGALTSILVLEKSLPFGYSKDLQEDKLILFDLWDEFSELLYSVERAFYNISALESYIYQDELLATDIAEILTLRGKSYRESHYEIGRALREKNKLPFSISVEESVRRKITPQGTSPENVKNKLEKLKDNGLKKIGELRNFLLRFSEEKFLERVSKIL